MSMKPKLNESIARAAGFDAAMRQMRKDGRKCWNEEDYYLAVKTFLNLCPEARGHLDLLKGRE